MGKLSTKARSKLPAAEFGLPEKRKYPMPDEAHARNAKARASQQDEGGRLSESDKAKIDRKADRIIDP